MSFVEAVKAAYSNYFNFSGRAIRSEYWWYALFQLAVSMVIAFVEGGTTTTSTADSFGAGYVPGLLGSVWSLVNFVPGISVGVRRLHDTDRSGWWLLLVFVPIIGVLVLLYWFVSRGTQGTNRFGTDPLNPVSSIFS